MQGRGKQDEAREEKARQGRGWQRKAEEGTEHKGRQRKAGEGTEGRARQRKAGESEAGPDPAGREGPSLSRVLPGSCHLPALQPFSSPCARPGTGTMPGTPNRHKSSVLPGVSRAREKKDTHSQLGVREILPLPLSPANNFSSRAEISKGRTG